MFENIIGQSNIVNALKADIRHAALPQALLFYGPAFTGKMTAALELARVISCESGLGEWQCGCHACQQHRQLISSNLLLLGPHYFDLEISAAADTLLRTRKVASGFLFMRAVRKLIKRFDPVFAGNEDSSKQKAYALIDEIEENLQLLAPERELKTAVNVEKLVPELVKQCLKLITFLKSDNIPIDQVRKIIYWAHFSQPGKKKIIIMENIDRMHEASRNALLKLLEEPPANVHLLLLTTQKGAIIKTILSRLRPYYFSQRSQTEELNVLAKIFGESSPEQGVAKYDSLHYYFSSYKDIDPIGVRNLAQIFLELVQNKARIDQLAIALDPLWGGGDAGEALRFFAQELLLLMQQLTRQIKTGVPAADITSEKLAPIPLRIMEQWHRILHEHIQTVENLNLDPQLSLESIFYKFREASA